MNTRNIKELEEAKQELIQKKPIGMGIFRDEVKEAMVSGEATLQ